MYHIQKKRVSICVILLIGIISFISAWNFDTGNGGSTSVTVTTGNATNFTQLLDVPNSYVGEADNCVVVNAGENGLTFDTCAAAGDTDTWNTTSEIWFVVNNGSFMSITAKTGNTTSEIWGTVNNNSFMPIGTNVGNTTSQMWTIINNDTFLRRENRTSEVWSVVNNGTFGTGGGGGNTTAEIWFVINNDTWMPLGTKTGNNSNEIWTVINNETFINWSSLPLANRTTISWKNITDLPTCSFGTHLYSDGSILNCSTDASGGGGNTTAEMQTALNNSGGVYNLTSNVSVYWNNSIGMNTTQFTFIDKVISLGEAYLKTWGDIYYVVIGTKLGNTTAEIQAVETDPNWANNYSAHNATWNLDTDTFNTTSQMWFVANNGSFLNWTTINNGTFLNWTTINNGTFNNWTTINNGTFIKIANRTAEVWSVANNGSFLNWTTINNGTFLNWTTLNNETFIKISNRTLEVWSVANNGSFLNWTTINNNTFLKAVSWNSTNSSYATWLTNYSISGAYANWSQVINGSVVANNTGGIYNITSNVSAYWNNSVGVNMTQHSNTGGIISVLSSWIKSVGDTLYLAIGTKTGNTSSEMWGGINNGSFLNWTTINNDTFIPMNETLATSAYLNTSSNIYMGTNNFFCLNYDCLSNITYNGSHTIWN